MWVVWRAAGESHILLFNRTRQQSCFWTNNTKLQMFARHGQQHVWRKQTPQSSYEHRGGGMMIWVHHELLSTPKYSWVSVRPSVSQKVQTKLVISRTKLWAQLQICDSTSAWSCCRAQSWAWMNAANLNELKRRCKEELLPFNGHSTYVYIMKCSRESHVCLSVRHLGDLSLDDIFFLFTAPPCAGAVWYLTLQDTTETITAT